jgi:hypothetical protein
VQDLARAATTLGLLRDNGVGVALDDFGTGYSSMLYLRDLPVTTIKIDRTFTAGIESDGDDRAIVSSLLTLARTIGLRAIAEGVETDGQARRLRALGCRLAQGYLWARPQPADAIDQIHREGLPGVLRTSRRKPSPQQRPDERLVARALQLLAEGASLHTIAAAFNTAGERTEQGARWHPATIARLIASAASDPPPV